MQRDTDNGYKALVERIYGLKKPKVAVGIFEADGGQPHGDEVTVADVAAWNEFGTETIPERSFLRAWFDENIDRAREALHRLMLRVVEGKLTKEQALEQFGLWVQGEIQKRIAQGISPPNAQSTINAKGSSKPLIDTGQLRSSVTFGVDRDGSGEMRVKPSNAQVSRDEAAKEAARAARKEQAKAAAQRRKEKKAAVRVLKKTAKKTVKSTIRRLKKVVKRRR